MFLQSVEKSKHTAVKEDMIVKIEGGYHEAVKQDKLVAVTGNESLGIDGDRSTKVGGNDGLTVTGDAALKVGSFSVDSSGDVHIKSGGVVAVEGGSEVHIKAGKIIIEADTQLSLKVGGNFIDISSSGVSIKGSMAMINSGGSAGSGSGCSPLAPAEPEAPSDPTEPEEADDDAAGEVSEAAAEVAERDDWQMEPITADPSTDPSNAEPQGPLSWVGVELVDDAGKPVPDAAYKVKLTDGSVQDGTLGPDGKARIDGVKDGSVEIAFPDIHGDEWFKA